MLDISFGAASDRGLHRDLNEDSVLAAPGLAVVADGMGGHAAGEVASQLAVDRLALLRNSVALKQDDVLAAIGEVNAEILRASLASVEQAGMGTTVSGVGVVQVGGSDHWVVFNVGDSRVYRFADDMLVQVTVDHSEVEELMSAGRLTADEAKLYPRRNVVTRSLGTDPAPQPDLWVFPPTPGERFLVCSDGLSSEIDDDTIASILRTEPQPQGAADKLVRAAVDAGGHDNVTAVVLNLLTSSLDEGIGVNTAPRHLLAGGR